MTNGRHGSVICLDEFKERTRRKSFPNARIDDEKLYIQSCHQVKGAELWRL